VLYDSQNKYLYDAEGTRVAKGTITSMSCDPSVNGLMTANGNETDYILGPGGEQVTELAQDANGTMNWQRTYVYAVGLIGTYEPNPDNQTQPLPSFRLTDWLGTMRATTDAYGVAQGTCTGLPFGDGVTCSGDIPDNHHFTCKERDPETGGLQGNDYFGARYYASTMGRFLSPDPISATSDRQADPQQLNLYSYVRNNPLTLTDPSGMIINTDDLNDKDKKLWQNVVDLANKKNDDGSYSNPVLHDAYSKLDSNSRTFRIEDDKSLGANEAGRFEITKFNGSNDFSEAKVELNFGVIKGISSTTQGDYDPSFQKYAGLFGKNGFVLRITETFGHEASHGVFAINDPAQGANIQRLVNDANGAVTGARQPIPQDVLQKVTNMNRAFEPTERFAQQQEKIINNELQQKQ
jgi:RHS repeat-associated protein